MLPGLSSPHGLFDQAPDELTCLTGLAAAEVVPTLRALADVSARDTSPGT